MRKFLLEVAQGKRNDLPALLIKPVLYVLSLLYGLIVRILAPLYIWGLLPSYKPNAKVISVGNITLGGTGKTPFVEYLGRKLSAKQRIVILSRGYSEDEPEMLKKNLPSVMVLSGPDRIKNAKKAEEELKAELIILDDGFQHWRLKRDLDIVMISSAGAFGNKNVVPYGILREPLSSLKRADVCVVTKVNTGEDTQGLCAYLSKIKPGILCLEAVYEGQYFYNPLDGEKKEIGYVQGKNVCLLSSIGNPDSFRQMAWDMGVNMALDLSFPDHHRYSKKDINEIIRLCRLKHTGVILTTEKDLIRLPVNSLISELEVLVLRMELKIIKNEEELFNRIRRILDS